MSHFLLPFIFFMLPAFFMFFVAMDIFLRFPRKLEYILSSTVCFSLCLIFITEFAKFDLPAAYTIFLVSFITYPASFLAACATLHFYLLLASRRYGSRITKRIHLVYLPLMLYFVTLLYSGSSVFFKDEISIRGNWKSEQPSLVLYLFVLVLLAYSFVNLFICIKERKQYPEGSNQRERFSILMKASVNYLIICSALVGLDLMEFNQTWLPDNTYLLSTLVWAISFRHLITHYGFLPSFEQKYKSLFVTSPVPIVVINRDIIVVESNPSANQFLGDGTHSIVGQSFENFLPSADQACFREKFLSIFDSSKFTGEEFLLMNSHGEKLTVLLDSDNMEYGDEQWLQLFVFRNITDRKQMEQYIQYLANHDSLTKLPNRLYVEQMREKWILDSAKSGKCMAILLIDLDNFKLINDRLGHEEGDQFLLRSSDLLHKMAGTDRTVIRWGGDEFLIIMPDISDANEPIELMRIIKEEFQIEFHAQDETFLVTASVGMSIYPTEETDFDALLNRADKSMYIAKKKKVKPV